jgi:NADH:ubiquinone oxidoreductase subunit 4 (subunit M)
MFYSDGDRLMDPKILAATLFLPLFPLSMLFNLLFEGLRHALPRVVVLLAWPQIGLWLIHQADEPVPGWVLGLALATSLLYGFRAIVLRELIHWIGFLAVSSWTILWVVAGFHDDWETVGLLALGSSIPLGILTLLSGHLEKRFGASYAGLYNGLGHAMPRFSGLLVATILAVVATPVFPGFATMMAAFLQAAVSGLWESIVLCLVWVMWAWAGARLIQGFVVGKDNPAEVEDLPITVAWLYGLLLAGLAVFGIGMMDRLS